MMARPDKNWSPNSELLAAYFDGEFEGRDELNDLRRKVESWLIDHPDARAELSDLKRLRHAWQSSTPPEPNSAVWNALLDRVQSQAIQRSREEKRRPGKWQRWTRLAAAAAAACVVGLWALSGAPDSPKPESPSANSTNSEDDAPFAVAHASEVLILRVEGLDAQSLVVGALPLEGPLELAGPGDITLTSVQPDARDNMVPHVSVDGPGRPLIWARADTD